MVNIELNYIVAKTKDINFENDSERACVEQYAELNNKGIKKCECGRFEEAILDFTEAINMFPDLPHAYTNRAVAKYQSSVIDYALSFGFNIDPTNFSADINRLRTFCHIFNKIF